MRLCWRLLTWQPDIVLAWLAAAVWVTLPLTAVLTRARRVAGFRGEVFERDVGLAAGLFRHAVKHAHAVTINSPSLRKEALRWGAVSERIFEIPNGVDVPAVTANVEPDPPTAVVVANFRDYKGHDVLIDALALVRVPVIVRLIGEGDRRDRTRVRALELGLGDSVVFVESPADVAQELSNAQFAIHPSRTEGLPNAILEELATGLPVVATDVGGTSLLVSNGVTGFLVPAGDAVRLAHGIGELAASGELRASMTGAAKSRAREFTWDKSASRHLDLFSMLTGRGP
jgi:glycosyltransferase involved in cell wall biosynthesis